MARHKADRLDTVREILTRRLKRFEQAGWLVIAREQATLPNAEVATVQAIGLFLARHEHLPDDKGLALPTTPKGQHAQAPCKRPG